MENLLLIGIALVPSLVLAFCLANSVRGRMTRNLLEKEVAILEGQIDLHISEIERLSEAMKDLVNKNERLTSGRLADSVRKDELKKIVASSVKTIEDNMSDLVFRGDKRRITSKIPAWFVKSMGDLNRLSITDC